MKHLVTVVLCCLCVVCGQIPTTPSRPRTPPPPPTEQIWIAPPEWEFSIHPYPNPHNLTQYRRCNVTEPSWLCDPNAQYPADERDTLISKISSVNSTVCTCHGKCLSFSVAIVHKFKVLNYDEYPQKTVEYANARLNEWLGTEYCGGILLFVSATDKQAALATQNVNMSTCDKAANISATLKHTINKFMTGDLNLSAFTSKLIDQYSNRCVEPEPDNHSHGWIVGLVLGLLTLVAIILGLVIACFLYKQRQQKKKSAEAGVEQPLKTQPAPPTEPANA